MSEYQLSHVALVGARISAFEGHGVSCRNDLKMRRIAPLQDRPGLGDLPPVKRREVLARQLPLWIHNIITDPDFPKRKKLLMPLRRFEGELRDKKDNEVISAVMTAGFRNQDFDPLDLPKTMPLRRRCSMVAHIGVWKDAYRRLENDIVTIMSDDAQAVTKWCEQARQPEYARVEVAEL